MAHYHAFLSKVYEMPSEEHSSKFDSYVVLECGWKVVEDEGSGNDSRNCAARRF